MNRKGRDRGAEMRLTERTRKLIPTTRPTTTTTTTTTTTIVGY